MTCQFTSTEPFVMQTNKRVVCYGLLTRCFVNITRRRRPIVVVVVVVVIVFVFVVIVVVVVVVKSVSLATAYITTVI